MKKISLIILFFFLALFYVNSQNMRDSWKTISRIDMAYLKQNKRVAFDEKTNSYDRNKLPAPVVSLLDSLSGLIEFPYILCSWNGQFEQISKDFFNKDCFYSCHVMLNWEQAFSSGNQYSDDSFLPYNGTYMNDKLKEFLLKKYGDLSRIYCVSTPNSSDDERTTVYFVLINNKFKLVGYQDDEHGD